MKEIILVLTIIIILLVSIIDEQIRKIRLLKENLEMMRIILLEDNKKIADSVKKNETY